MSSAVATRSEKKELTMTEAKRAYTAATQARRDAEAAEQKAEEAYTSHEDYDPPVAPSRGC